MIARHETADGYLLEVFAFLYLDYGLRVSWTAEEWKEALAVSEDELLDGLDL